jgi:hypothetical protein
VHAHDYMGDRRELRSRAITRDEQRRLEKVERFAHYREAGIMWAQGLFESCAQARAHFGLALESSNAVRHHYMHFSTGNHNESESQAFDSFEKFSVPKCSKKSCPCQGVVFVSSDSESVSDVEMAQAHWQTLLDLFKCREKSVKQVALELQEQTGVKRSRSAIQKYRTQYGKKMPVIGRPTFWVKQREK